MSTVQFVIHTRRGVPWVTVLGPRYFLAIAVPEPHARYQHIVNGLGLSACRQDAVWFSAKRAPGPDYRRAVFSVLDRMGYASNVPFARGPRFPRLRAGCVSTGRAALDVH